MWPDPHSINICRYVCLFDHTIHRTFVTLLLLQFLTKFGFITFPGCFPAGTFTAQDIAAVGHRARFWSDRLKDDQIRNRPIIAEKLAGMSYSSKKTDFVQVAAHWVPDPYNPTWWSKIAPKHKKTIKLWLSPDSNWDPQCVSPTRRRPHKI